MMLPTMKQKKNCVAKGNRLLISINVLGSAGPLRFLVNDEELVIAVIETALKNYSREGRLPILGSDLNDFLLYSANAGTDALSPWDTIGSRGGRNFVLFKKPPSQASSLPLPTRKVTAKMVDGVVRVSRKGSGSWKSWINKHSSKSRGMGKSRPISATGDTEIGLETRAISAKLREIGAM